MTILTRSALVLAFAGAATAQQLEPVYLSAPAPGVAVADAEPVSSQVADLPYGDIVVAEDEASLDLRAEPDQLGPLVLEVLGGLDGDSLPADAWVEVRGVWVRLEGLPYKPGWSRVRMRVGSFSPDDVERAADMLSELAGLLTAPPEDEAQDEPVAEPGGSAFSTSSAPASFDPGWVASAYDVSPQPVVEVVHVYHWASYSPWWIWSPWGLDWYGGYGGGFGYGYGFASWDDDIWFGWGSTNFGGYGQGWWNCNPWWTYDPWWGCDPWLACDDDDDVIIIVLDEDDDDTPEDDGTGDGDGRGRGDHDGVDAPRRGDLALGDLRGDRGLIDSDPRAGGAVGDGVGGLPGADDARTSVGARPVTRTSERPVVLRRSVPTRMPVASSRDSNGGIRVSTSSSRGVSDARSVRMPSIAVARYPRPVTEWRGGTAWDGGADARGGPSGQPFPGQSSREPWSPWAGAAVGGSGLPSAAREPAPLPSSARTTSSSRVGVRDVSNPFTPTTSSRGSTGRSSTGSVSRPSPTPRVTTTTPSSRSSSSRSSPSASSGSQGGSSSSGRASSSSSSSRSSSKASSSRSSSRSSSSSKSSRSSSKSSGSRSSGRKGKGGRKG